MAFDGHYLDWNQKRIKGIVDFYGYKFMYMKKLLDLGCGYADISGVLHRLGADVTAVDARPDHLKIVNKKFSGIKTVRADLDRPWPFTGKKFDITLDLGILCHLSDFESHLKSVCASTTHLVLETAVCDSDDSSRSVQVQESKNIYDLSANGLGCRPSAIAIERVLQECGMNFRRLDDAKFNAGPYVYDWASKNDGSTNIHNRRIWFAVKNSSPIQFAPPAPNTPNTEPGKFVELPFVKQWSISSPTPPYTPPTIPTYRLGNQNFPNHINQAAAPITPIVGAPKTRLFYYYYDDSHPMRKQEIDSCLQSNINNNQFNLIVLSSEEHPTFDFFFQKINQLAGPDDISIICSPDMFFDNTISLASRIREKEIYALTCSDWHRNGAITPYAKADKQGAWIIKGNSINVSGNFPINIPGADNRIAYEFQEAGYKVINPCLSIRVFQVHDSGVSIYSDADRIQGPAATVEPTSL